MPITTDVRKFGDTLVAQGKTTLTESTKPLYAIVGANDLAVEKVRDRFSTLQSRRSNLGSKLVERVTALPQDYKSLPTTVKNYATDVTSKATEVFGELTDRGEKVVKKIRRRETATTPAKPASKTSAKASKPAATKTLDAAGNAAQQAVSHLS